MNYSSYIIIGEYRIHLNTEAKTNIIRRLFCENDFNQYVDSDNFCSQSYVYETSARIAIERLECFGITKKIVQNEFAFKIKSLIEIENFANEVEYPKDESKIIFWKSLDFKTYSKIVREIVKGNIKKEDSKYSFFKNILIRNNCFLNVYNFWFEELTPNYPNEEYNWIYTILQSISEDTKLYFDVNAESFSMDNEKIIILTEGKTDTEFIEKSFKLLFPNINSFYHFINYNETNLGGGASLLTNSIKSFIGSNIKNKIIGIFDNDTVGNSEIKNIKSINLPDNIKILKYPPIKLLNNYPSILPPRGEIKKLNVNGLAGSIEMYLGNDVLLDNEELYPINWSNYNSNMKQYQGALLDKDKSKVQEKFKKKLKVALEDKIDNTAIDINDWKDMKSIIELIKKAWHE